MTPSPKSPGGPPRSGPPAPLTSIIGREQELALAVSLLGRDDVRLLTLTGPGGVGKTRLAVEVAGDLAGTFADGVHVVPLAPVRDAGSVAAAVARSFRLVESGESDAETSLADRLRDAHLLLVLDNFEHVLPAAPLVSGLLAACPGVKVLVTSRSLLRVSGEQALPVPPLPLPPSASGQSLESVAGSAAVRLFVSRARSVDPAFRLTEDLAPVVAAICQHLDGLPLAIELAAAQVNVLAPGPLLTRIQAGRSLPIAGPRDAPGRLRTLHDTVAWSYDLLPGDQQHLFRVLGAFVGGFGPDAVDHVLRQLAAGPSPRDDHRDASHDDGASSFEALATLVDRSLLRAEPWESGPRFSMLETFRVFAAERLVHSGEEESVRDAHADWCLDLAEGASQARAGAGDGPELRRLEAEHANLLAALDWLERRGDHRRLLRLAAALGPFWYDLGHMVEGRRWLQRALDLVHDADPLPRARAVAALDRIGYFLGDQGRSEARLTESIAVLRAHGDVAGLVATLVWQGWTAIHLGRLDDAERILTEALDLATAMPDREVSRPVRARVLANLGAAANERGDLPAARARHEEALRIRRAIGDAAGVAHSLRDLGLLALDGAWYAEATEWLREALALLGDEGYPLVFVDTLNGVAAVAAAWGHAERAARLLGAAAAERERELFRPDVDLRTTRSALARAGESVRGALGDERMRAAFLAGRGLSRAEALAEALAIPPAAADAVTSPHPANGLSRREAEVARLLIAGRSDREIADALFISVRTAEGHVARILAKLGVSTRAAAATAIAAGGVAGGRVDSSP